MDPVGKYFKTEYEYYYCYGENAMFRTGGYDCLCVDENSITTHYFNSLSGMPKSTRRAFMSAYDRTTERLDEILTKER